jgi:integrase
MGLDLDASDNKHFREEEIMIAHDEKVQKITGQQDRKTETEDEEEKVSGKTATGKCSRRADIFTDGELERFFNFKIYGDSELYLFYLCCLTAGLRPGEARGLRPKQILFDRNMLIVDGSIKKNGIRTAYNKKGQREYWKLRIVPLPDLTLSTLKEHIERKRLKGDDFIFTAKKDPSRPITEYYIHDHMARIIREAGIQAQGQKLAINSFRYTFINRIRRELPTGIVMKLVGRKLFDITDHYHNRGIDASSAGLARTDTAVQKLLTKAE